jgi:SAM-dependent methyltransferase
LDHQERVRAGFAAPTLAEFESALAAYFKAWPRDGYYLSRPRFSETYALLRRFYNGGPIVDVGAWPGDLACTLASLQLPVSIVDKNPERPTSKVLDEGTGAFVLGGPVTLTSKCQQYGVRLVTCDIERDRIPLAGGSVQLIVCTEVVSHLRAGLLHAVRECRRLLAPEGHLLVTSPNLLSLTNRLSFLLDRAVFEALPLPYDALDAEERIGHSGMFRLFSMRELTDLIVRCGFRIVYAGYRHLVTSDNQRVRWTPGGLRLAARDIVARSIPPLGNALFIVAQPDVR